MTTAGPGDDCTRPESGPLIRMVWLTDVHLNFVAPQHIDVLCRSVKAHDANAVLLTGG